MSIIQVANNAITDISEEEYGEILLEMYEEIDDEYIEIFDEMEPQEIKEQIDSFNDVYELGEPLSNVSITKYSGTIKSMNWKTSHKAYGLLGTSGKNVSLGVVYSGSMKSSNYTSSFSFSKTTKYSAVLACYISTWGTLDVKTSSGEFNMNTNTYSSWE